jgi:hypothetical protein
MKQPAGDKARGAIALAFVLKYLGCSLASYKFDLWRTASCGCPNTKEEIEYEC